MNPISNKINGVFIPVSHIENARDWYSDILGLPADGELFLVTSMFCQWKVPISYWTVGFTLRRTCIRCRPFNFIPMILRGPMPL